MIGFDALGKLGRLGNQMFQYASLKGIARNRGYDYCIPPSLSNDIWNDHQLFTCFNLKSKAFFTNYPAVSEKDFSFDEDLFNNCPDNVSLWGFYQTEKYFEHIKEEIKNDFQFKDEIIETAYCLISNFKDPISLHIRRTDYVTNPNHTALPLDYYKKALDMFDSDREIIIFSDDPKWCLEQQLFSDDRFSESETGDTYIDLCLMTLCSDHIIANSSFSWWGAWLAKNNKVIAPSGWFAGSNNEHLNLEDIIPKRWETI
jgi:hypothetical protein